MERELYQFDMVDGSDKMVMMSAERACTYQLAAWVNGKKMGVRCDPSKGCLQSLVWNGNGIEAAAAEMLSVPKETVKGAYVEGVFEKCSELQS